MLTQSGHQMGDQIIIQKLLLTENPIYDHFFLFHRVFWIDENNSIIWGYRDCFYYYFIMNCIVASEHLVYFELKFSSFMYIRI